MPFYTWVCKQQGHKTSHMTRMSDRDVYPGDCVCGSKVSRGVDAPLVQVAGGPTHKSEFPLKLSLPSSLVRDFDDNGNRVIVSKDNDVSFGTQKEMDSWLEANGKVRNADLKGSPSQGGFISEAKRKAVVAPSDQAHQILSEVETFSLEDLEGKKRPKLLTDEAKYMDLSTKFDAFLKEDGGLHVE